MSSIAVPMPDPVWINSSAALAQALQDCGDVIGVDTEFQRTDTFYPIAGLFQVSTRRQVFLLDPLQIDDFTPFVEVLQNPAITKVMHACMEDLELLWHRLQARPVNVFDTQLAYAYFAPRYSVGFVGLVEALLDLELAQSETRSDWLRRPLTPAQIHYAAEDVWYLLPLHDVLRQELTRLGRLAWFTEDMLAHGSYQADDPAEYYRGVSRAWSLDEGSLGRLQDLCSWREHTARRLDIPRRRLVLDEHLLALAQYPVLQDADLGGILPPGAVRRYGREIRDVHAGSRSRPEPLEIPLTPGEGKQIRKLKEVAADMAASLDIASELLARRRDLEALFRHYRQVRDLNDQYSGWRRLVVGDLLLATLGGM